MRRNRIAKTNIALAAAGVAVVLSLIAIPPERVAAGENFDRKTAGEVIYDIFWDARLYSGVGGFPSAIEWSHNAANKPASVNAAAFEAAVEAGFDAWEAVDDGLAEEPLIPVVSFAGPTIIAGANALDGVNVIEWSGDVAPAIALTPCWALTDPVTTEADPQTGETRLPVNAGELTSIPFPGPAGVTYPRGALIDCGIAFSTSTAWSTEPGPQPFLFDVQAIATHEAGHFLGVTHSTVGPDGGLLAAVDATTATMVPGGPSGNILMRTLEEDDRASILRTYARNANPPLDQTIGGRGVIKLNLKKGTACEAATGLSVWAYRTSEGAFGANRVETFSGSHLRLGLGEEPVDGSVTLNVPPLAAGESYTILAQTLEQGLGAYSAQRYNQTTINSNTLEGENQRLVFDGLAVVDSLSAGETVDLGDIGIDNCWPPVSGSEVDLVADAATAPTSAVIDGQIAVTSTFSNQGTQPSGAFEAGIYFSADAVIDADDAFAGLSCSIANLAGGGGSCDGVVTVPSIAPGTYYVGVLVDRFNGVGESNESNNGVAAPNQVEVTTNPLDPIVNGSFETGDLSGWTVKELDTASNPNMALTVDGAGVEFPTDCLPVSATQCLDFFGSQPTDGQYAALHDFNGDDPLTDPGTFVNRRELYQDVTLPAEATTLLFDYRAAWELYRFGSTMDRTFGVEIEPAGGGAPLLAQTVLTAYNGGYELDTDNPAGGGAPYPAGAVNVSAFAGQNVRVKFVWNVPEPATGFGFFQLDNVRVGTAPNAAPAVVIGAPPDGTNFLEGDLVNFSGSATDAEDGDLSASLAWSSNLDGPLGSGAGVAASLSVGTHTITASATDSLGASGSDAITVTVTANTPPVVVITSPLNGLSVESGTLITFAGTATDTEDGELSSGLSWVSDLDGTIGSGASFSTGSLSVGMHTVTASVSDSGSLSSSDLLTVVVQPSGGGTLLFSDGFGGALSSWTIVDEGTTDAPSNWFVDAGILRQTSNIFGGSTAAAVLPKPGTYLLAGEPAWADYTLSTRLRATDNDGLGVMFRYQDGNNYYRFSMDSERGYRRLVKNSGGAFSLLFEDDEAFQLGQWYDLDVVAVGDKIQISINGETWATITDASFASGRIALYSWGNDGLSFDFVNVVAGGEIIEPPTVAIVSPVNGFSAAAGSVVSFSGNAADAQDGDLSASLTWTSTIDGPIGTGASFAVALSPGVHTITAAATDSGGATAQDTIVVVQAAGGSTVLWSDDFSGSLGGWTIVDEGTVDAPSNWFIDSGVLRQASNIYGGSTTAAALPKPGTYLLAEAGGWANYTFAARLKATDDDGMGVMFRYEDSDNYYRFSMDAQRGTRRLVKKSGGNFTLLAEDADSFALDQWIQLHVIAVDDDLLIYIDGQLWDSVSDSSIAAGRVALYSWGNDGLSFDDVLVLQGASLPAPPDVTITIPADGAAATAGEAITLEGAATDPQDGDLTSAIEWESNLDGPLGTGGSVSTTLSAGVHTITARVVDSTGLVDSAQITITAASATGVLFGDDFSGSLASWSVFDEGTTSAPSNWHIDAGTLRQSSNIYGGSSSGSALPKPGTYLLAGSGGWTDYTFSTRLMSTDDDGMGVMFRYEDSDNYYRFSMDAQRKYRRLVKKVGGAFTLLAEEAVGYQKGQWYEVQALSDGGSLSIYLDGELWAAVSDSDLTAGRIALYSWGNDGVSFDDVLVVQGAVLLEPPTVTISSPADGSTITLGDTVTLEGAAGDSQDGDLTAALSWSSSIDGELGAGGSVAATLSLGVHTITASATDSVGLEASDSITVTVSSSAGPLFSDDFSGSLAGWSVVDEGTTSAPSNWFIDGGELRQTSNIYGGSNSAGPLPKPGTYLLTGEVAWTDYIFSARMKSTDDDGMGMMFRYQDGDNYYRFSMDSQRKRRRLVKKVGGTFTLLAEDSVGYKKGQWYDVQAVAVGDALSIYIDGQLWSTVTDADLSGGRVAMYSWGNNGLSFDDVVVE